MPATTWHGRESSVVAAKFQNFFVVAVDNRLKYMAAAFDTFFHNRRIPVEQGPYAGGLRLCREWILHISVDEKKSTDGCWFLGWDVGWWDGWRQHMLSLGVAVQRWNERCSLKGHLMRKAAISRIKRYPLSYRFT